MLRAPFEIDKGWDFLVVTTTVVFICVNHVALLLWGWYNINLCITVATILWDCHSFLCKAQRYHNCNTKVFYQWLFCLVCAIVRFLCDLLFHVSSAHRSWYVECNGAQHSWGGDSAIRGGWSDCIARAFFAWLAWRAPSCGWREHETSRWCSLCVESVLLNSIHRLKRNRCNIMHHGIFIPSYFKVMLILCSFGTFLARAYFRLAGW